ncbi:MMPL family transporter [Nocardia thailandica]|uniref:MMPL family transporter n=1 Tax=Nocardia thailandica TaxID=257275 RepID=UPI0009FC2EF3|nr:MMPL family transporter [Nocardia thailandica]
MFPDSRRWAAVVVRRRYTVILVVVAGLLALGGYGLGLGPHLDSGGWDDPGSESVRAAQIRERVFGRDHSADVLLLFRAPAGSTVDDPAFAATVVAALDDLPRRFPDRIGRINGAYWPTATGQALPDIFGTPDRTRAFASVAIRGADTTTQLRNYRAVAGEFGVPGVEVEVAGAQPVGAALTDTMAHDQRRMELVAVPLVAVLLYVFFGGVVAAALPLIVGGLTVGAAWGVLRLLTGVTDINSFTSPVVSMIGLGLAIDYGLFVLSRFRDELADGHEVDEAVRRAMVTAGRTVASSALVVAVAAGGILVFPQGFLRSFAYGAIITVCLAALTSITLLPALLAVVGRRVDWLGIAWFRGGAPRPDNAWGRVAGFALRRPLAVTAVVCLALLALALPLRVIVFGSVNERFLPPDHPTRLAQQHFDEVFPLRRIDPIDLVLVTMDTRAAAAVVTTAGAVPGLAAPFPEPLRWPDRPDVLTTQTVLAPGADRAATIDRLRALPTPPGTTLLVGGQPAVEKDSIDALLRRLPLMIGLVFLSTTALLALSFRSVVLPLKAAVLNLLGLGATLGVLTWIFVQGNGSGALGFTPQPIMSLVLVVIVAVVYGLSTDYEVFLLSRIVEERDAGADTPAAIRAGVAATGRIITAAALILLVVTGAFAFSDLLMMQYIAFGMVTALLIDATVIRLLLVPAVMRILGDFCWWSPIPWRRTEPTDRDDTEFAVAVTPDSSESSDSSREKPRKPVRREGIRHVRVSR